MCLKCLKPKFGGGEAWELQLQDRLKDKLYLEGFGYKVFSQNDEDGIINEIFNRIGTTNKKFIEFGISNGLECNSHLLLITGWSGLWIEAGVENYNKVKQIFKTSIENNKLKIENSFITKDNINEIFKKYELGGEIDFLSVDIDGNDWHIVDSILKEKYINPRVICTEYNPLIPPANNGEDTSTDWIMEYKEDWRWHGDNCHSASLSAFYHLLKKHNYNLVGTSTSGVNAFFVRADLTKDKFVSDKEGARHLYNPPRFNFVSYSNSYHPGYMALNESMENRLELYKQLFKK